MASTIARHGRLRKQPCAEPRAFAEPSARKAAHACHRFRADGIFMRFFDLVALDGRALRSYVPPVQICTASTEMEAHF